MVFTKTIDSIYNPGNLSKNELIERFVVRHKLFDRIYREIKTNDMFAQTVEHLLIVGLRGMGKTTLLLRLAYEIEQDKQLNTYLLPIVFAEEQYAIRTLYSFWENIAKYLGEEHQAFEGLFEEMDQLYSNEITDEVYEQTIFNLLINSVRFHGKKVILFIDNIQDLLKKLSKQETQRLREVLMTCKDLRIIAAAPVTVQAIYDDKHPLYEQFKPFHLKGLNFAETKKVLKMLSTHFYKKDIDGFLEKDKGRIKAMLQITGGVVRTIVLLFEIFMDDKNDNIFKDLDIILDRVSVLFKDRTDDLPKNQQAIVNAIAMNWDAISTKEIAIKTRMESKFVSAQLAQLSKNDWIEVIPTTTKNHLYQLKERFYNIWYLMRYGRKNDEKRVLWLVKFFKEWYDESSIKERVDHSMRKISEGRYEEQHAKILFFTLTHSELGQRGYILSHYPNLCLKVYRNRYHYQSNNLR